MRALRSTFLKRALLTVLVVGPILALISVDVEARRGGGGGRGGGRGGYEVRAPRANVGGGYDYNRGNVNRRDVNVNHRDVNVNRDVNINRNVDVDVDRHWGYPVGAAAVAVGTAVAVGAIVSTLPSNCTAVVADGVTYQSCGGAYYAPRYDGPNVVYEVVPAPSGWNQ